LTERTSFPIKSIIPIYVASFLGDKTTAILSITIPIYAYQLGASPLILGLIGDAAGLTYTMTAIIAGRFSDRVDKRILLLVSVLLQSTVSFAYSLSSSYLSIVPLSGLQGVASGIFWPNMESLLVDKIQPIHLDKAITGFTTSWSIGWIIGPFLGGAIIELFSPKAAFYTAAILPLIAGSLVILSGSKGVQRKREKEPPKTRTKGNASLKGLTTTYISVFLFAICIRTVNSLFPALTSLLKISALETGSILLFISLARTLLFVQSPILVRRLERKLLMILGSTLISLSAIIIAIGFASWHFMFGMIFLGLGYGMNYFSALSTILGGEEPSLGLRVGLFEGIIGFGGVVGPMLGGILSEIDMRLPYIVLALVTFSFVIYQSIQSWRQK